MLRAVRSFPGENFADVVFHIGQFVIGTNERATLCDNDNLHARCELDAYKLEDFNGIIFRRNGENAHGGNQRIVKGDRANGVLEGSFNELIFGLGIMSYQSGKGGFAMRMSDER